MTPRLRVPPFLSGPSQAILKQAPGAEIVDFLCAQGFRAARTEGAKS